MPSLELLNKYNVPVPRYTSYPTVPYWKEGINPDQWKHSFKNQFSNSNLVQGLSLYIHLPFCESLCTYCGCNKKITTNHKVENEYINAVLKEWQMYRSLMEQPPVIREIHLGGGTPTFFSPIHLNKLLSEILKDATVHPDFDFGFEGHPNNTTKVHLDTLYQLGFRRVSFGVQDNDPEVQRLINRIQPFETVRKATTMARESGFNSVNFDLIYGLPSQTIESIQKTMEQCISLKPDRLAFYSYAHVPWTSRGQRLFDESNLPRAEVKLQLYMTGKASLLAHNYQDIGMDHFALPGEALHEAWQNGTLHRNFMGYTTHKTSLMIGLGVSAISDATNAFAQNAKTIHDYYARIEKGNLPVEKGFFLTPEDEIFRKYILDMSCKGETFFDPSHLALLEAFTFPELYNLQNDGLVTYDKLHAKISPLGRNFIRNICRAFDVRMLREKKLSATPSFSNAI